MEGTWILNHLTSEASTPGTPLSSWGPASPQGCLRSPPRYMPRKPSALAVFIRQSVLEAETRRGVQQAAGWAGGVPSAPSQALSLLPTRQSRTVPYAHVPGPSLSGTHIPL